MQEILDEKRDEVDLNLRHLQAEIARIEARLARQVHRWQLAGQDPADNFRGLYVSDADANSYLNKPFATSWGDAISLEPGEEEAFVQAEKRAAEEIRAITQQARQLGKTLRLEKLAGAFGLDPFERDILLICLAPALDLRYERLYGYLQDDVSRKKPTVNLALDLLAEPGAGRLRNLVTFSDRAPLFKHGLLEKLSESSSGKCLPLSQALSIDETILRWLLGDYHPQAEIARWVQWVEPEPDSLDKLLAGRALESFEPAWPEAVYAFYGPDQASQDAAARLMASQQNRPLLIVDLAALASGDLPVIQGLKHTLRDARLMDALPYLAGWEACLEDGAPPVNMLAEVYEFPGPAVISSRSAWQSKGLARERSLVWLEFPIPAFSQRIVLWKTFLSQRISDEELDLSSLAAQFLLSTNQIRDAVLTARDTAAQGSRPVKPEDLFAAARAHSNPRLASLARKIVPRYGWEDIVLPNDQISLLGEIVATVRGRPQVLEEWGIGQKLVSSEGVTVLFAGPPGTGKTMAAEVIAAELGLDLYKIDLSMVVSKYIGETEKNLERIFNEAEASNAILFFDEADALFGKRSEVRDSHDRYANIEISYLLQRMEAYDGVTILATNLRANLDEAFTRRLQFAVDFPFPEEADRLRIWQTLFPPGVPSGDDIDLRTLARRFKLAGGNIRNILVSAAYLAASDGGVVHMGHLLHGTRRELQKMGRLVNEQDLDTGLGLPQA